MSLKWRFYASIALLVALAATAAAKLVDIQIIEHERWRTAAERIQVRELVQSFPRGRIYDRNGLLLAFDVQATSIALDNFHMTKPELLEELFQRHLQIPERRAEELIYQPGYFTWIARKVNPDLAQALKRDADAQGIHGLLYIPEWKRVYPQGGLASNVIGFAGLDNRGLEGLELAFDELLSGQEEQREVVRGADGTILDERVIEPGAPGSDLHLTLDAHIQHLAEEAIQEGVRRYRAQGGFALVMAPQTGELLAIAQDKTYDLNAFERSSPQERKNLAVGWPFEPGSTFKPFAMLAALDAGAVDPDDVINGDQPVVIAGHPFHNAEYLSYGPVTPTEIIARSINTGMIRVAQRLGAERLYRSLERMAFGRETGLPLPGEAPGVLRPLEQWSQLAIGSIPIGQGISVTGIQLARAYAAVADGGRLRPPQIIQWIDGPSPAPGALPPNGEARIASRTSVAALVEMMEQVVHGDEGTGIYARVDGFRMAGKSGTGQKAVPGRGYVKGKYVSLFAGFFPADDPRYLVLVVLDEVGTRYYYGGQTAAPVFKTIAEGIIDYVNLEPEELGVSE